MRKLLWVGDAGCDSGFARCTHAILDTLKNTFEVVVLGLNYRGYPHEYPYPMYPAWAGGDLLGVKSIKEIVAKEKPDIIVLQNDPWNIPHYMNALRDVKNVPPVVGAIAIDSKNARGYMLNTLRHVIFWTDFAATEAVRGGLKGPSGNVIGLGVDLDTFYPGSKLLARKKLGLPERTWEAFIVGNVNRNQPRKRIDLTIEYFADWYHTAGVDAYLYLHVCPTGDVGVDVEQLTRYYKIADRLIYSKPDVWKGLPDEFVRATYQSFDAQINTAIGEGWSLTTLEGMACGIPQIVPDCAALGEWPGDAAIKIPVTLSCAPGPLNQIGGILDKEATVGALDMLFEFPGEWARYREAGLKLATEPRFDWRTIGEEYEKILSEILNDEKRSTTQREGGHATPDLASSEAVSG